LIVASISILVATSMVVGQGGSDALVFVSRQIPPDGSIYFSAAMDMPGVGARSRFRVASPGRLMIREQDGKLRVLIDGSTPSAESSSLIDVNAPDVSYDGREVVFAGLPSGNYDRGPNSNPGAWRLYRINIDGTGLQQLTKSDQSLDLSQFGDAGGGLRPYDDTDPVWLPDGRVVFSSTRWPSYAQYSGVRTTNLYVVNADGSGLHRITSERNGADRPLVDPLTGKIVYSRWWRNHRFALDDQKTIADSSGGYLQKDGLTSRRDVEMNGASQYADFLWRNVWNPAEINPDGTDLKAWGGSFLQTGDGNGGHVYGGAFSSAGDLFANFFPMFNMTEAAGFGGIRRYSRGPVPFTPVVGVTATASNYANATPPSYGVYQGGFAGEPEVTSEGLVVSWASDVKQDYGLYRVDTNGAGRTPIHDNPGTSELRARVVRRRPLPPVLKDSVGPVPSLLPPLASGRFDQDGTFVFDALNVYANASVDTDIVSAPPVGSAATIRFFLDHQRTSPGSFPNLDWPILLGEAPVSASGAVRHDSAPAEVPLFEQLRSPSGTVPVTRGPYGEQGAGHVAGMNFGRSGTTVRCVGCHIGHTMIPVPANPADAAWTNLAPGARVTVSSSRDASRNEGLIDRRVLKGEVGRYWASAPGRAAGEWVQLTFPVPITVRAVRLYNPRTGGDANSSIRVQATEVQLCSNDACDGSHAIGSTGALSVEGTVVSFSDVPALAVRVKVTRVAGSFYGSRAASLAEIEVIARGGNLLP
jgi:hypothetical protein